MKKLITVILFLFLVGHPPRADAQSADKVTSDTTITFVTNPNIPKPTVPGGEGNLDTSQPTGSLPKTGEVSNNLIPTGTLLISLSTLLYFKKRASKI